MSLCFVRGMILSLSFRRTIKGIKTAWGSKKKNLKKHRLAKSNKICESEGEVQVVKTVVCECPNIKSVYARTKILLYWQNNDNAIVQGEFISRHFRHVPIVINFKGMKMCIIVYYPYVIRNLVAKANFLFKSFFVIIYKITLRNSKKDATWSIQ